MILAEILLHFTEKIYRNVGNHLNKYIESLQPLFLSPRGNIALYSFRACEAMPLMEEVGRLREEAFRAAGGGTGRVLDIDSCDLAPDGYRQLVAWDMVGRRVVGGYRYLLGAEGAAEHISTLSYFQPSERFERELLPRSIELGRSFLRYGVRSLYAMESLWRALAQIVSERGVDYLFGKVTVYPHFDTHAHNLIRRFLKRFHPAPQPLLRAKEPLCEPRAEGVFTRGSYEENLSLLHSLLRSRGERMPPMLNAYMRLGRGMQSFDTILNRDFGNTYETAILLPVSEISPAARERYFLERGRE